MPYIPTGRPNGRPRKTPEPVVEASESSPVQTSRSRKRFRKVAEMLNPSPFIVVYDGRGRPRHAPRHSNVVKA